MFWRSLKGTAGQHLSEPRHYLGVTKFVLSVVNVDGRQQLLTSLLAVDELSLRDCTGVQHSVSAIVDTETIVDHQQRCKPWRPTSSGLSSNRQEGQGPERERNLPIVTLVGGGLKSKPPDSQGRSFSAILDTDKLLRKRGRKKCIHTWSGGRAIILHESPHPLCAFPYQYFCLLNPSIYTPQQEVYTTF